MDTNDHDEFVGTDEIRRRQRETLASFERWAAAREWQKFHEAHYDWWMFPIDQPSGHGFAYTVFDDEIAELKSDPDWIAGYLRGVELLSLAWGWSLRDAAPVITPDPGQQWARWPIRLWKAATSLRLFGFTKEFESLRRYAQTLLDRGEPFSWQGRDLSSLFR